MPRRSAATIHASLRSSRHAPSRARWRWSALPFDGAAGGSHIAMLAVAASGASVAYRKLWLGTAEAERFTPGAAPAVLELDGWRLGLAICKDTGSARHAADTAALGIDAYLAGVLESAADAGVVEARARRVAGDHGIPVVVASFAGSTGGGFSSAAGGSAIWRADGELLDRAGAEPGAIARATLTPEPAEGVGFEPTRDVDRP